MSSHERDIETLVIDYATALRDGTIPVFLKSLSKQEAHTIDQSRVFPEALEIIQLLNEMQFADKVVQPDVGLFISRVNAEITSRMKKSKQARIPSKRVSRNADRL